MVLTLCTKKGHPILSAKFDGRGGGFSGEGQCTRQKSAADPYRKRKLDLKLKVAKRENYPLFVVSFEESDPLQEDTTLTIVDGIVGQVLTRKRACAHKDWKEQMGLLPSHVKHDKIQTLIWGREAVAELSGTRSVLRLGSVNAKLSRRISSEIRK